MEAIISGSRLSRPGVGLSDPEIPVRVCTLPTAGVLRRLSTDVRRVSNRQFWRWVGTDRRLYFIRTNSLIESHVRTKTPLLWPLFYQTAGRAQTG